MIRGRFHDGGMVFREGSQVALDHDGSSAPNEALVARMSPEHRRLRFLIDGRNVGILRPSGIWNNDYSEQLLKWKDHCT